MRGWVINHPYITVHGFHITRHSGSSSVDAYVRVNNGGSHFELLGCSIENGIGVRRDDIMFIPPNEIHSQTGGFLQEGFFPGQTIQVHRGTNQAVTNRGTYVVAEVADTYLVVTNLSVVKEGPKPVYITGSANFAVVTWGGTTNCLFRGNHFRNLSFDFCLFQGMGHLIESNLFEVNNGWDMIYWAGTNSVFRGNWFRHCGWGVHDPSPDVFDNWPVSYENIFFTNNFVQNIVGVINAQKRNSTVSGPLYIRHNVFVDTGFLWIVMPHTHVEHNTFLRVARESNVLVQLEPHPLIIDADNYASNCVIRSNIFVDCGQVRRPLTPEQVGWYRFIGTAETAVVEGNYAAGAPPQYASKSGWAEAPTLNGGDPGFLNIDDPLGPDGLPFTADDGLQLRPDSKLIGAGPGGATLGAYELSYMERVELAIERRGSGSVVLRWPRLYWNWQLEAAPALTGPWRLLEIPAGEMAAFMEVETLASEGEQWYRLVR